MSIRFDWDPTKNLSNIKKHQVSFEEASTVFLDENGLLIADPDHSDEEDRFILMGLSSTLRLLIVCHCYRAKGGVIRIISAQKADRQERQDYLRRFKL
ncbi:BrnT family toxin [Geothrix limicola]|uniref:BrnT family toxin n=1 Tax=Geothrix limicola TaxID=2927978 RepID=UPI002553FEB4|nr:BrnT family toxin [Geothrix limicola]